MSSFFVPSLQNCNDPWSLGEMGSSVLRIHERIALAVNVSVVIVDHDRGEVGNDCVQFRGLHKSSFVTRLNILSRQPAALARYLLWAVDIIVTHPDTISCAASLMVVEMFTEYGVLRTVVPVHTYAVVMMPIILIPPRIDSNTYDILT